MFWTYQNDKKLEMPSLKAFADKNLLTAEKIISVIERVENIVRNL